MELMFWMSLLGIVFLVAAGAVERILARPSRRWVRRLNALERARADWQARCITNQSFWKDKP